MLYLDHAATSPVRPEVLAAMAPFFTDVFGNPSSQHTAGEAASLALEDARGRIATLLGMRTGDVIFTAGGTEANNLAVKGITLAALGRGRRHVISTPLEHESILESLAYLQRFHGVEVTVLRVSETGRIAPDDLSAAMRPDTALISLGHANNEIGTVQDAAALATAARASRVPLHLDAVQSAGWLDLSGLGADALSLAGHKLGAPKGIGVLAVRGRVPLEPLLHGGGQERGRRSGTQNVAGAVGMAVAMELAEHERAQAASAIAERTASFCAAVLAHLPHARLTGDPQHRLPGTASFTIEGVSGEAVLLELERRGVISSSGSACAAGHDEPSHVLLALGVGEEVARTALRFTFGRTPLPPEAPAHLARMLAEAVRSVG